MAVVPTAFHHAILDFEKHYYYVQMFLESAKCESKFSHDKETGNCCVNIAPVTHIPRSDGLQQKNWRKLDIYCFEYYIIGKESYCSEFSCCHLIFFLINLIRAQRDLFLGCSFLVKFIATEF